MLNSGKPNLCVGDKVWYSTAMAVMLEKKCFYELLVLFISLLDFGIFLFWNLGARM
jgi:hypothetical protein